MMRVFFSASILCLLASSLLSNTTAVPDWGDSFCPSPAGLAAASQPNGTVLLKWSSVGGAIRYEIEVEQEPSGSGFELKANTTDTFYALNNLVAGGLYKFKVRAYCADDKSDWSAWFFFNATTGGGGGSGCAVPLALSASNVTETSALLSWASVSGALLYQIEVEQEPSSSGQEIKVATADTVFALSGLKPGSLYKFKVRAHCGGDKSDWSAWVFFSTSGVGGGGTGCGVPTGLTVAFQGDTAVLQWAAVAGAAYYSLEIEGKPGQLKWKVAVQTNAYLFPGLLQGVLYKFKVRTHCTDGTTSAWTKEIYFSKNQAPTPAGGLLPCSTPTGLQVLAVTPTSAELAWNAVPGAVGYYVELEREPSGSGEIKVFTPSAAYSAMGLVPGQAYKFKVRALCASGRSKWSPWLTFQTPPGFSGSAKSLDDRASTAAPVATPLSVQVRPNPISTSAHIWLSGLVEGEALYLQLYDLAGRPVWETRLTAGDEEQVLAFPADPFPSGVYLLRAAHGAQHLAQKVIISR